MYIAHIKKCKPVKPAVRLGSVSIELPVLASQVGLCSMMLFTVTSSLSHLSFFH